MLEKVRRTEQYRVLIVAYRLLALGMSGGVLSAFLGSVLDQPWPCLLAMAAGGLAVIVGLPLGFAAMLSVYPEIRYASSVRFTAMACRDVVRGVPKP